MCGVCVVFCVFGVFVFLCFGVPCCVVVWVLVLVLVCNVCLSLCGVWRGLAHGKPPVWTQKKKTPPYVSSGRLRVYQQNVRMLNTCGRFAGRHGDVNAQTDAF